MAIDISSIIQNHLSEAVVTESATDTTGIKVDFTNAVNNVSTASASIDEDHEYFLSQGELDQVRGAILATAVANNVTA